MPWKTYWNIQFQGRQSSSCRSMLGSQAMTLRLKVSADIKRLFLFDIPQSGYKNTRKYMQPSVNFRSLHVQHWVPSHNSWPVPVLPPTTTTTTTPPVINNDLPPMTHSIGLVLYDPYPSLRMSSLPWCMSCDWSYIPPPILNSELPPLHGIGLVLCDPAHH